MAPTGACEGHIGLLDTFQLVWPLIPDGWQGCSGAGSKVWPALIKYKEREKPRVGKYTTEKWLSLLSLKRLCFIYCLWCLVCFITFPLHFSQCVSVLPAGLWPGGQTWSALWPGACFWAPVIISALLFRRWTRWVKELTVKQYTAVHDSLW